QRLGLSRRVDFVLASAIERAEKPDREMFERALARAGARPEEALHAGDDLEKDVLGARRAGLSSVLVDHAGTHGPGVDRAPDRGAPPGAAASPDPRYDGARVANLFE